MRSPRFTLIIPTRNRAEALVRCIEAVLRGRTLPERILVVDNASTDDTRPRIRALARQEPRLRLLAWKKNNVAAARNRGARAARTEWIAFLDDDCVVPPVWLQRAARLIRRSRGKAMVLGGDYLLPGEPVPAQPSAPPTRMPPGKYLPEGNLFLPRKLYLAFGGMNPALGPNEKRFGYHEGTDLQIRIEQGDAPAHPRILARELAVYHHQKKKNPLATAFLVGFDLGRLHRGKSRDSLFRLCSRTAWVSLRMAGRMVVEGAGQGVRRDLVRIGEIWGSFAVGQVGLEEPKRRPSGKRDSPPSGSHPPGVGPEAGPILRKSPDASAAAAGRAEDPPHEPWDPFRALMRGLRKANNRRVGLFPPVRPRRPVAGTEDLVARLRAGKIFAAGKIGGAELMALEYGDHHIRPPWPPGWSWRRPASRLMNNAGFFPVEKEAFQRWQRTMREAIPETDFLCAWQTDPFLRAYEDSLIEELAPASRDFGLENLGLPLLPALLPFRWLVVSPFVLSIRRQLGRLRQVHDPKGTMKGKWDYPAKTCQLVRCPFQSHLEPSPYPSWEEGLEQLSRDVAKKDFEVAFIGAGAWSLPLAVRIKASGRSAIHLGGQTQLMFGIKGKRWGNYGIYNGAWVSADPSEMPAHRDRVEQGCYW